MVVWARPWNKPGCGLVAGQDRGAAWRCGDSGLNVCFPSSSLQLCTTLHGLMHRVWASCGARVQLCTVCPWGLTCLWKGVAATRQPASRLFLMLP